MATLPMPWSMVTDVAPVTLQFKLATSPAEMLEGLAPNELIVGDPPTPPKVPAGT
jgi:hypothetical protein